MAPEPTSTRDQSRGRCTRGMPGIDALYSGLSKRTPNGGFSPHDARGPDPRCSRVSRTSCSKLSAFLLGAQRVELDGHGWRGISTQYRTHTKSTGRHSFGRCGLLSRPSLPAATNSDMAEICVRESRQRRTDEALASAAQKWGTWAGRWSGAQRRGRRTRPAAAPATAASRGGPIASRCCARALADGGPAGIERHGAGEVGDLQHGDALEG